MLQNQNSRMGIDSGIEYILNSFIHIRVLQKSWHNTTLHKISGTKFISVRQ